MGLVFSSTADLLVRCCVTSVFTACLTQVFRMGCNCLYGIRVKSRRACKRLYLLLLALGVIMTLMTKYFLPDWETLLQWKVVGLNECYKDVPSNYNASPSSFDSSTSPIASTMNSPTGSQPSFHIVPGFDEQNRFLAVNDIGGIQSAEKGLTDRESILDRNCVGNQSVYRSSFCLSVLFIIPLVFALCGKTVRNYVFHNLFGLKFAFVPLCFIGLLFAPNSVFDSYGDICIPLSLVFLLLQSIYMIDLAYTWNDNWVIWAQEQSPSGRSHWWLAGVLASGGLLWLGALLLTVYMYAEYSSTLEQWVVSITFIGSVLVTLLSISQWIPHGALLPASVVSALACYQTAVALRRSPSESVSRFPVGAPDHTDKSLGGISELVIGLCLASATLVFVNRDAIVVAWGSGAREGQRGNNLTDVRVGVDDTGRTSDRATPGGTEGDQGESSDEETISFRDAAELRNESIETKAFDVHTFCFGLLAASIYLSAICSDWQRDSGSMTTGSWPRVLLSFWVKMASAWITLALYGWTLIAPLVLSRREF